MQRGKCSCVDARQLDVSVYPVQTRQILVLLTRWIPVALYTRKQQSPVQRVSTSKVFKEADPSKLPLKRPAASLNWSSTSSASADALWLVPCAKAKFVVSTGLNPAATKAFIDALRLSRPGTDLHATTDRSLLKSAMLW